MAMPMYNQQIDLQGIPSARVSTLPVAEGIGGAVGRGMQTFAAALRVKAEEFEDAETLDMLNQFQRDVNKYHHDVDKGVFNTRLGKHAPGMADASDIYMSDLSEKYAGKLRSSRASSNFMNRATQIRNGQFNQNMQWEQKQIEAYRDAEAEATIGLSLDSIGRNYLDDELVESERGMIYQALELKLRGAGDEARRAAVAEMEEKIAVARINQMIQNDPLNAEGWLKERKDDFSAETYAKLQKYTEQASEPYRVEAIRDEIMATIPDEGTARKFILDNFEGDFEKKIMSAVEAEFSDRRRIQRQREADAYDHMQDVIASAGSYSAALSAISRSGLPPRLKDSLTRQAASKFGEGGGGGRGGMNPDDWADAKMEALVFQSGNANMTTEERHEAAKVFVAKWADKVTPSGLKSLVDLHFSRTGSAGGTGSSGSNSYNRFNPMTRVSQMARDAGIFDDYREEMKFYEEFSKAAEQEEERLGRKMFDPEILELGEKFTADVVIERKNNLVDGIISFITGGRVNRQSVETTVRGYEAAALGLYDDNVFWDEESGGYFVEVGTEDEIDELMSELDIEGMYSRWR